MDYTEAKRLKVAEFLLKNEAEVWWESIGQTHEDDEEPLDYELFKVAFEKKYVPGVARDRKALKFSRLVLGQTSVAKYKAKFSELFRYASHLEASPKEKAHKLHEGLALYIQLQAGSIDD